tara:strand:- start:31 stop:267 length:237 start_codon:yes stop_codon:yes gene_type:complete
MNMQTVYEYMMEQGLLNSALEACENDNQREATKKHAQSVCEKLDPFINSLRNQCKSEDDRKALLESIITAGGQKNANE